MDEQRRLLDQLMGRARDAAPGEKVKKRHFDDPDVCKFHLLGICPYVLFQNTRSDLGYHPDGIEDDDECKKQFEKLSDREKGRYGYESKLLFFLRKLVARCDERIEKQKSRQIDAMITEKDVERVLQLENQMKDLTANSEKLAEEGEVEQAQALMSQVEKLKLAKEKIAAGPQGEKRMIVCEVSGNLMSNTDNEERIQAHFNGKMYIGWKSVRDKVKELEEKERNGTLDWGGGGGRSLDRDYGRSRSRDRDRSRRSRDGGRKRRSRSRERDRGRKGRDRDRSHRDRSRDRDSRRSSGKDRRKSDRRDRSRDSKSSRNTGYQEDNGGYNEADGYYGGGADQADY